MLVVWGMDNIAAYEDELLRYATDKLNAIDGMRIFGQAAHKGAVLSFLVGNIHHYDMGCCWTVWALQSVPDIIVPSR